VFPDQNIVAVHERLACDPIVVDVRAVQRIVVFDYESILIPQNPGVMTGDREVVELNGVVRESPDGDDTSYERHFLEDGLLVL
jgi:hypothetical protein